MNIPPTMTAAVTTAHGGPEVIDVRQDWPTPTPMAHQALVRVGAAAVNSTDLWSRRGAYGSATDPDAIAGWRGVPLDFPRIQGMDIVGVVVAVGKAVDPALLGRRVLIDPAVVYDDDDYPTHISGSEFDGGFAQFHVAAAGRLHDVTDSPLTDEQLSCLPTAYGTAMGMINRAACVAGERVLVTGASGGVGFAAVQLLVARGCHVIAFTSARKVDTVARANPAEVITREDDALVDVADVDAVVDVVGGDEFASFVGRLRSGGRLVTAGAIAGPVVPFDIRQLYLRQRTLIGSTMHSPNDFAELVRAAVAGEVSPIVAATYPLEQIGEAQAHFERKDFVGKLVLVARQP